MILADGVLIVLTERGELLLVEATPKRNFVNWLAVESWKRAPMPGLQIALANGKLYARDRGRFDLLGFAQVKVNRSERESMNF